MAVLDSIRDAIAEPVRALGDSPLTEDALRAHIHPLFSRVLDRDEIYLANHSLGRPLDQTADDVRRAVDAWYADLDGAWDHWMGLQRWVRTMQAALVGVDRPDAVAPKTSAAQGLRAVLNALPERTPKVIATAGEFDSIDFVLKAYHARERADVHFVPGRDDGSFHADDIAAAIDKYKPDLVVVSAVFFATGQVLEGIETVLDAAKRRGARTLVDLYHTAGTIPVNLTDLGADFAIGGSYKYTRGGPGACWLAINPRHLRAEDDELSPDDLVPIDTGWFAKRDVFAYHRTEHPEYAAGGDAWLEATPPVLTYAQAVAGLELTLAIGVERLRAWSISMQDRLADAFEAHGCTPTRRDPHGPFLLLPVRDGVATTTAMRAEGLITDARPCPVTGCHHVRFCPDMLTTSDEINRAAEITARVLDQLN